MIKVEENLNNLGIHIPDAPTPVGAYKPAIISGNIMFVSGQLPIEKGKLKYKGKVGSDISLDDGVHASKIAAINILSVMRQELGDLDKINRILKLTGYVASAPGFDMQAKVVNGASELFYQVFGENGIHARAAVGVFELPLGAPVEIEAIAEIVYK
ncbi:MAG: RidA family protein [Thermodesulfobacteriota bacterium]